MGKFFGDLFDDLKLYARQIAWWNATPKRQDKVGKTTKEVVLPTRARQAADKDADLYFPPLPDAVRYLLEYLQSLGYVEHGMGGPLRLSHQEIAAWGQLQGVALQPWEVDVLRGMSQDFAQELVDAEAHTRPPPWSPTPEQIDRPEVARRIKDVLRG